MRRIDADLEEAYRAEQRTLYLRTVWFPTVEFAYVLPVAATLAWGGWLVSAGHASIGEVTTVALYVQQLADPVDRLISWLDEIQVGATSFARLVGVSKVPDDRAPTGEEPDGRAPARARCATRTSTGATCCTGSTSTSRRASASRSSARRARQVDARPAAGRDPPAAGRAAWTSAACGSST